MLLRGNFKYHFITVYLENNELSLIEYGVGCGSRFSRKDHSWLMITTKLECLADKKYRPEISTIRSECLQSVEQAWFIKEFSLHID